MNSEMIKSEMVVLTGRKKVNVTDDVMNSMVERKKKS
jgi:hypothetical protein